MKTLTIIFFLAYASICFGQANSIIIQLNNGTIYTYQIPDIKEMTISGIPTGIKDIQSVQNVLKTFTLYQNYPNPFSVNGRSTAGGNPSTTIKYEIPSSGAVAINIYDIRGRLIYSSGISSQQAGRHALLWNGRNNSGVPVPSGTYFCRVLYNDSFQTNKLLIVK